MTLVWLKESLASLSSDAIDVDIYGDYILGILEDDSLDRDEQSESIQDFLSSVLVSFFRRCCPRTLAQGGLIFCAYDGLAFSPKRRQKLEAKKLSTVSMTVSLNLFLFMFLNVLLALCRLLLTFCPGYLLIN